MKTQIFAVVACVVISIGAAKTAPAGIMSFAVPTSADFEFVLVQNGPLWTALEGLGIMPPTGALPFRALGDVTFEYDDTGVASGGTVPFTNVSGLMQDADPSPGLFRPFTLSPEVQFFGGQLSNIVREQGEIVSGDVTISMDFTLVPQTPNPLAGVNFFTDGGLTFNAVGVSIPFANGTHLSLSGDDRFNVYQGPDPNPVSIDPATLSAIGQNRTLTTVPEPNSLTIVGLMLAGGACLGRKRMS